MTHRTAEHERLAAAPRDDDPWKLWGPYTAARQWGTVREDYSADGDAWDYFPFDHAHRRAYRWGEDALAGLTDRFGFFAVGLALWNGHDDRLKERLFGLTNGQGNHGEDVKEVWWPLDATPTHSYASWLYRYPQAAYPYAELVAAAADRDFGDPEYELTDTGIFEGSRFFDVRVTHAKSTPTDVLIELAATNQGPDPAPLDLVPQGWFRNTWAWGRDDRRPTMRLRDDGVVQFDHDWLGRYELSVAGGPTPRVLFCDNETDNEALFGVPSVTDCPKDGIDRAVVHGDASRTRADQGTKVAFWWHVDAVGPGETVTVRLRLHGVAASPSSAAAPMSDPGEGGLDADRMIRRRRTEAEAFYAAVVPAHSSAEDRHIARRAFAGLLWGKQLYRYGVDAWLDGDPGQPDPPRQRHRGRNAEWAHLDLADVISMPDAWEYPWFASWDLAFHTVPLAEIDPEFAKRQLELMCREWAQHPNGQLPAYEWNFTDVNPPVHAWAAWQVYLIDGRRDREFLVRIFSKLLMNFSWWINRKDADGSYLFEGGFLGMDNIGLFDRSKPLPGGLRLEQSDATSWMAFYALSMLRIAVELARSQKGFDDTARTFFEYFLRLAHAMDAFGSGGISLWSQEDGFYYDAIVHPDGHGTQLPVRSLVGLLPLIAIESVHPAVVDELPGLLGEVDWVERRDPRLADVLAHHGTADDRRITMSLVPSERRAALLARLLDEAEFLSPHGIRSLSAAYRDGFTTQVAGETLSLRYAPGESDSGLFGGNSNWRGPVWFPVNFLLLDALRVLAVADTETRVELPTGSGDRATIAQAAEDLTDRLVDLFRPGEDGRRPGTPRWYPGGPLWDEHVTFSEYFHGDTGAGLGATHQTGWTAVVAHLICRPHGRMFA